MIALKNFCFITVMRVQYQLGQKGNTHMSLEVP